MPPSESKNSVLEAELAELSRQIEKKRSELERERGIVVESKTMLREIVSKEVVPSQGTSDGVVTSASAPTPSTGTGSVTVAPTYLDSLDPDSYERVMSLITAVQTDGIKKTIARAREESPYILDAFHDALVDKLYEELKRLKLV
jgi:hypothetical protein